MRILQDLIFHLQTISEKKYWKENIDLKRDLDESESLSSQNGKEETPENKHVHQAKTFLNKIKKFSYEKYEGVGLGSNLRATKSGFIVAGLYYQDKVIHLSCVEE